MIMITQEGPPFPLLAPIYATIQTARRYVRERQRDSPLHWRLREAAEILSAFGKVQKQEGDPFWYTLFEELMARYVQAKHENRRLKEVNMALRKDYKELKERYFDAISRIDATGPEVDSWNTTTPTK